MRRLCSTIKNKLVQIEKDRQVYVSTSAAMKSVYADPGAYLWWTCVSGPGDGG